MTTQFDSVIEVRGASVTYIGSDGNEVNALVDVDLSVTAGEFVALVGPSGCGKTTLLKVLANLIEPSSGEIHIRGQDPARTRQDRQIGFVFQDPVLLPWKSVGQNVSLLADLSDRAVSRGEVDELLQLVGLDGTFDRLPSELSGGMRQRAAIARALALDPLLMLMDEPFGAVDEMTRARLNDELLRIWETRPKTIVFVTHSIHEAVYLADRVVVMASHPGRIVGEHVIDLPRPRSGSMRFEQEMFDSVRAVHDLLESAPQPA
jgi:NitT/TauT family transport system ATP-binding protein